MAARVRRVGPSEVVVADPDAFVDEAAHRLATLLRARLAGSGAARISLALSGGSTPVPVHRELARRPVPWERVDVFQVDERVVAQDHGDRNLAMIRDTLVDPAGFPEGRVHPMPVPRGAEEADPELLGVAARRYAEILPSPLDLVLLGIGEDAHTASLFPDDESWTDRDEAVLVTGSAHHSHRRLTLAPGPIRTARSRVMLARGGKKAEAVARALQEGPVGEAPARLARGGLWILDEAAASAL